jgi:hypothetical protein
VSSFTPGYDRAPAEGSEDFLAPHSAFNATLMHTARTKDWKYTRYRDRVILARTRKPTGSAERRSALVLCFKSAVAWPKKYGPIIAVSGSFAAPLETVRNIGRHANQKSRECGPLWSRETIGGHPESAIARLCQGPTSRCRIFRSLPSAHSIPTWWTFPPQHISSSLISDPAIYRLHVRRLPGLAAGEGEFDAPLGGDILVCLSIHTRHHLICATDHANRSETVQYSPYHLYNPSACRSTARCPRGPTKRNLGGGTLVQGKITSNLLL